MPILPLTAGDRFGRVLGRPGSTYGLRKIGLVNYSLIGTRAKIMFCLVFAEALTVVQSNTWSLTLRLNHLVLNPPTDKAQNEMRDHLQ